MTETAHPCPLCRNDRGAHPMVCGGCEERGARLLADLPRLVDAILAQLGELHSQGGDKVSGSKDQPLPGGDEIQSFLGMGANLSSVAGDIDPDDALCQVGVTPLPATLAAWAKLVAEERGFTPPKVGRVVRSKLGVVARSTSTDVPVLVEWLSRHHTWLCRHPAADEYLAELGKAHAAAVRYAWEHAHRLVIGCCISVGDDGQPCRATLRADPYADAIRCTRCRTDWPRRHWLLLGAAMQESA